MDKRVRKQFLNAVFFSDLKTIREICCRDDFDLTLLEDTCLDSDVKIPVTYLTAAQREIFRDAPKWAHGREWVLTSWERAEHVWVFWRDEMHLDMRVDYATIAKVPILYVSDEFDDDEDILDMTFAEALAKGFREIDITLIIACHRVEARQVANLLKTGADQNVSLTGDEEEMDTAAHRIDAETAYMDICVRPLYEEHQKKEINLRTEDYFHLLNLGAHLQIQNLLNDSNFHY